MARLVLADASPLIGLARVEGLCWLQSLFGNVWIPSEVKTEVLRGFGSPDEQAIGTAMASGWLAVCGPTPGLPALPELDEGETACIRLALAHSAGSLVLMDELAGRAIALGNGLQVAGTAGVIGMARLRGLIPSAKDVFARLHGSDFRISSVVIQTILDRVGES
jgi:predicted nucleic acid-binding protein